MFDTISNRLNDVFSRLRSKGRLSEADVDAALREVRLALLEADVNVGVVKSFLARIKERAVGAEVTKSLTPGQQVVKIVHEELLVTLGEEAPLVRPAAPPLVILMVGLQGSGKTTTAAKLAKHLKGKGRRPLLVAADLQRPAAIDQLETLGRRIGVPVYADRRASRINRLAKAAIKHARDESCNVIIIDTAGRLQIDEDLMRELSVLEKTVEPDEVLLVVDAMTGQEAVNVAQGFLERTELTGLVLTKLDGDARGGAAISAREVTGRPIKFVGLGESLDDLDVFHPDRMASRILGMGDVLTLIEKAETAYDEAEAAAAVEKLRDGQFNLEDFLEQFQQLRKMGPLQQLVSMLPGAGQALRNVQVDERNLSRFEAIIRSMTPQERRDPRSINGSRKRRIAAGSGTRPQDVNAVLKQFAEAQKMMKAIAGGRGPIPGLPGMGRIPKR